ncbi:NB-ARC domain-containing protein [Coleofasciculus sp. FACHB-T130]|uniref:NB-ARC domain-containing protein n=1 Tax=Cyanophyceae TaxID=3028117 RepID=UPI00168253EC|nr:NB-ARC domain-containing protein [Coleofasciculus sp. FACHB-T130]MBD1881362.1 XRE family transcriptional regulator [Coleofasciculus sp. FACHB-T130]
MPSLRASQKGLARIKQARNEKGWTVEDEKWLKAASRVLEPDKNWEGSEQLANGVSLITWKRFLQGKKPINTESFKAFCQVLGVNWEEVVERSSNSQPASPIQFSAYNDNWVGESREILVKELSNKVLGDCRVLILVGITGIGKTALAERLVFELRGDWTEHRENFEDRNKDSYFASVAARWLEEWGEKPPQDERKPEQLRRQLVKCLCEHKYLVLMDSFEELLTKGKSEDTRWNDFADDEWRKFFLSLLSEPFCQSRIIITSQDFPVKLKLECSRYQNFWHHQLLKGLEIPEQVALFRKARLEDDLESPNSPLRQIGEVYDGHPLALRVIVGEIAESYQQNVRAYWKKYRNEIEEVKNALDLARKEGKVKGEDDRWHLERYSHELQNQVKIRLDKSFDRLKNDVYDAYFMLCTASVYRCEVAESWWLSQLEYRGYDQQRCEDALQALRERYLVEDRGINHEDERLFGQHNLIRSVAIAHRLKLYRDN